MTARLYTNPCLTWAGPPTSRFLQMALAGLVLVLLGFNLLADWLAACHYQYGYYVEESALFGVYWLLFLPFWRLQQRLLRPFAGTLGWLLGVLVPAVVHAGLYPALIYVLAQATLGHGFGYRQTLEYLLTTHYTSLLLLYLAPVLILRFGRSQALPVPVVAEPPVLPAPAAYPLTCTPLAEAVLGEAALVEAIQPPQCLVVPVAGGQTLVPVASIDFIEANPPYCTLYCGQKKYLLKTTLRQQATTLQQGPFRQVHKSLLVNIARVTRLQSRHNGDYDLLLADGRMLRLSRTYAAAFKAAWEAHHRVGL